ncbi:MAG: hypothetical protein K8I00_08355, partial [Candidatus Omnitrophica bacterium]|nr:hypothetical protein [Candidatus Omnitrophota bacterium]
QRVGLAGGLNVGVMGAGYDIQITHGVNGWLINAFPNVQIDELIDMFNVGVKSEFKQRVIRNMYEYWNRARPQLREYIAEAVQIYRAYGAATPENARWTEMLKSAFDQAHDTVTIEHNNIRNKMAFDAALDGSGTQGIRRRKQLGEHILTALGPVINALTRSRLEGTSVEETAVHIQDLGWYLVQSDGTKDLAASLQPYMPALVGSRQQIIAEIAKNNRDADAIRKLITEELAVDVTYRVQRTIAKSDKAILVIDDDVADEPIGGYERSTRQKYHAVDGHVTLMESTYDGKSDQTTHQSVGLRGVVPYFVIMEPGNQIERGTEAIIALYERGGYRSEASTNVKKTASLDGREISLLSRYDAQSNITAHYFAGIKDGPRRDRLPAFVLMEPEPGFFALRTGQEIMALRAKGFYP